MEALFSGISAAGELAAEMLRLICSGCSDLAQIGNRQLGSRERRRHAVKATLKLGVPALLVIGILGFVKYQEHQSERRRQQAETTREAVATWANRLHACRGKKGDYKRVRAIDATDAWDRAFHVEYQRGKWGESLRVVSAGRDGELGTIDDIAADRQYIRANQVAQAAAQKIGKSVTKTLIKFRVNKDREEASR